MPWLDIKVDGVKYFNGSVWYKTFIKLFVGLYYERWGHPKLNPTFMDDILIAADDFQRGYPQTTKTADLKAKSG